LFNRFSNTISAIKFTKTLSLFTGFSAFLGSGSGFLRLGFGRIFGVICFIRQDGEYVVLQHHSRVFYYFVRIDEIFWFSLLDKVELKFLAID
jgi:hypothetical protein